MPCKSIRPVIGQLDALAFFTWHGRLTHVLTTSGLFFRSHIVVGESGGLIFRIIWPGMASYPIACVGLCMKVAWRTIRSIFKTKVIALSGQIPRDNFCFVATNGRC